jgi:membrane-bound lytic murein transglycosylase F
MVTSKLIKFYSIALLTSTALLVAGCNSTTTSNSDTQARAETRSNTGNSQRAEDSSKLLKLVTTASQMTFFESSSGADGFEFSLMKNFADKQGYKVEVILANSEADVFKALSNGHADIALTARPTHSSRSQQFKQSQAYMEVTTQLIYRHGSGKPKTFEQLEGKRIVVADLEHFHEKYDFLKAQHPQMYWEFSDKSIDELLQEVNNGKIDYTLISSHEYLKKRSLYTRTRAAFDLYYPEAISLHVAHTAGEQLLDEIDHYLDQSFSDGSLEDLKERFFGHADDINPLGSNTFFRRVNNRLPHYIDLIEQVAIDYDMDWRLLAAIAYQESHWNPNAKSPTGVRGMMMLTQETAEYVGIRNRLDTAQSLVGGAIYFNNMLRRLPEDIQQPDRTWFALAAYNVGLGHIFDARKITEFQGGNPDRWTDVQKYLPLLEKKDWYQFTKHGFARGSEPVSYVQNIRQFHELLEWRFPSQAAELEQIQISVKAFDDVIKEASANDENGDEKDPRLSASTSLLQQFL